MSEAFSPKDGALRAGEARFYNLFDRAPIGLAQLDMQGRILEVNEAVQEILGYDEQELRRMTFIEVTHPEDQALDWALFAELVAGIRDGYTLDKRYIRKDGGIVWGHLAVTVSRDPNGAPESILGMLVDVTERHTTEDRLRESEARYRRIVETAQEGIWQLDTAGTTTYVNRKMADMLGYTVAEMVGESAWAHLESDTHAQAQEDLASQRDGTPLQTEARLRHRDGRRIRALIVSSPLFDPDGQFSGVLGMVSDITERTKAEAALRASEERYQQVERSTPIGLALQAPDGCYLRVNPALCALLGYSEAELLGRAFQDITHPDDLGADLEQVGAMLTGEAATYQTEKRYIRKDGAAVWVLLSISLVHDAEGQPAYFIEQTQDISARIAAETALQYQASHDALTDLPNRARFMSLVQGALSGAGEQSTPQALLLLNISRFKEVNNTLGHANGDMLLRQLATRLSGAAPAGAVVARLGGDEFAVLLPNTDGHRATASARAIQGAVADSFLIAGVTFDIEAGIGIAVGPEHGTDAQTLLQHADLALHAARFAREGFAFYAPRQDTHSPERLSLLGELRRGIEQGQLFLVFQPQINIVDLRPAGVEVLVRWRHPQRGLVPPDQFIGLAEETGAIRPLTAWVLEAALQQCDVWRTMGLNLGISVNISARNLHDVALPTMVSDLLERNQVSPSLLTLEITESTIMDDPARALMMLTQLSTMGIRLEIDDFGTGYSSLGYLKRLPVDGLKVDKTFVLHLVEDARDEAIVTSTITLAHSLGLHVVAEGVETAEALARLTELGCDVAQGYYLSRPLPAEALERWLRTYPSGTTSIR